jgi:hypothetical protein
MPRVGAWLDVGASLWVPPARVAGFSVHDTGTGEIAVSPVQVVLDFIRSSPNYVQAGSHEIKLPRNRRSTSEALHNTALKEIKM